MTKRILAVFLYIFIISLSINLFLTANDGSDAMRWGLFIGANQGSRGLDQLLYADDDAYAMAETLTELGGVSPGNAEILIDPKPIEILQTLDLMAERFGSQPETTRKEFIFYYSGHSDDEGMLIGNEKLLYTEVKQKLSALNSDVTVAVLDSCSSGAFTRAKGGVHRPPFLLDDSVQTEGHAYLTSSSASEISQESDLIGGSFFTYFLISGLRGAADENGDGRVTLNEVYQHTYSETISRTLETGGVQHPTYEINLSGSGDLVMTDLNQPSAVLVLEKALEGQLFLKNSEGLLVLETNKEIGQIMPLALPAGEYVIQIVHSTGLSKSAPIILEENQSLNLGPMDLTPMGMETARSRGNDEKTKETPQETTDTEEELRKDIIRIQTDEGFISISSDGIEIVSFDEEESISVDSDILDEDFLSGFIDEDSSLFLRNQEMKEDREYIPFALTVVPGIGTADLRDKEVGIEIGLISSAAAVNGIQYGHIGANTKDYSNAIQVGGIYTLAQSSLAGVQAAGIYGSIDGELEGVQATGIFGRINGHTSGIQANGIGGTISGDLDGIQANGIFSLAFGSVLGIQSSGIFSNAHGAVDGIQASGCFNIAGGDLDGIQAAGLFNTANGNVNGIQAAGLFNYAKGDVSGLQVGLVNVANSLDGVPLGLINLYREGITTLGYWGQIDGEGGGFYYSMMTGNKWAYTHFFVGGSRYDFWEHWDTAAYGFGLGFRIPVFNPVYIDIDINQKIHFKLNTSTIQYAIEDYNYSTYYYEENYDLWDNFLYDNWGNRVNLLGRAVITTDWKIQPYWGVIAELKKTSLINDTNYTWIPENGDGKNGMGIKYNMIFGVRMDIF